MSRRITRRDFLNGAATTAIGLLGAGQRARAGASRPSESPSSADYPPALTGIRGSHRGSADAAHSLVEGTFWDNAGVAENTGETYDLVVVGAGISGLAAAHFYRKVAGPSARILLLENHDDVGGHARRNEFHHGKRTLVSYGGSYAIDSPGPYSEVARGLVSELGIDVSRDARVLDRKLYASLGLGRSVFFDRETFGADRLLPDPLGDFGGECDDEPPSGHEPWPRFMSEAPLPDAARQDFSRLCRKSIDYIPGTPQEEKKRRLSRMSYQEYLKSWARVHPMVSTFLQSRTHAMAGVGIDAVSAQDARGLKLPGFQGLGPNATPGPGMDPDFLPRAEEKRYFFHFPDGVATVARLLVRALVPDAMPGRGAEESFMTPLVYDRLDRRESPVKVRLKSSVVKVRNDGATVEVSYVREGKLSTVRAARCVLACWNSMVPYICPELPERQRQALAYGVKVPLVYTNVLLRNWTSFVKLSANAIHAPAGFYSTVNLGRAVSVGDYRCPRDPAEPMVLHLVRTPCRPGLPARQQHREGRMELLDMSFETFERRTRDQLARILSPGGFDPARDIEAITVNRWAHGYAYEYSSLWDPIAASESDRPCVIGRQACGRISIANADSAAYSYMDASIDQAHRAVQEVLKFKS